MNESNQQHQTPSRGERINESASNHFLRDIFRSFARYLRGQLVIIVIMSSLYAAGFFFVRVPLWWLAGLLCGPFHLVPVIGTLFAAVIPITLQLVAGGGFWDVLWVLLVIAVVQLLETFYLTPKILGRELNLHPLMVILAVFGGALLAGPVGALLAAPVVTVALLAWRRLAARRQHPRS